MNERQGSPECGVKTRATHAWVAGEERNWTLVEAVAAEDVHAFAALWVPQSYGAIGTASDDHLHQQSNFAKSEFQFSHETGAFLRMHWSSPCQIP